MRRRGSRMGGSRRLSEAGGLPGKSVPQWPNHRTSQSSPNGDEKVVLSSEPHRQPRLARSNSPSWTSGSGFGVGQLLVVVGRPGRSGKRLHLCLQPNVPICVVFQDQGMCQILLNHAVERLARISPTHIFERRAYVLKASIWPLQEPLLPSEIELFLLSGGNTFSRMSFPAQPLTQSMSSPVSAAARVMASRRSVREGRLMTNIFSN